MSWLPRPPLTARSLQLSSSLHSYLTNHICPKMKNYNHILQFHYYQVSSIHTHTETEFPMDAEKSSEHVQKELDDPKAHGGITQTIIPHLLNIYGSCATAKDFEIYAPHATFEDPLMRAHGVKQIKSAFYSLTKVFSESKIVEYSIQENAISPEKAQVLIDSKQHYKIFGKDLDIISLIKLNIEDGKIVRHEDLWNKKPLKIGRR
ncbi:uncharacterized protein M6B38_252955 [Iris pallida]|uniref:SnoaL-like domain-containing protein n=1 Tax=Iris pallida TaxID=29817 RepID=A0AAX6IJ02_IRIPA|nr:uncharacterized protein M6B38_252955 [Iris pallida]